MSAMPQSPNSRIKSEDIASIRQRVDGKLARLVPNGMTVPATPSPQVGSPYTQEEDEDVSVIELMNDAGLIDDDGSRWLTDPFGDRGKYKGEFDEDTGFSHGKGSMAYADGRHYQGEWEQGHWHGQGTATFANKDKYTGDYKQDQRHGFGKYEWYDGRLYEGDFRSDQRHGSGTYKWPDGAEYNGAFKKGLRHGYGKYRFSDGSVYNGEWSQGKYHGKGECRWSDGRFYKGDWNSGRAHGQGVETRPDGSIRHSGKWENDRPVREPEVAEKVSEKSCTDN